MNKDEAYAVFTSGQHRHNCPGFDCTECYHCFNLVFEALSKMSERELTLNRERLAESIYYARNYGLTKWREQIMPIKSLAYEIADAIISSLPILLECKETE